MPLDLRSLIAETLAAHVDVLNRDRSMSCTCGDWLMLSGDAADIIERQAAEHRLHRADALLAALGERVGICGFRAEPLVGGLGDLPVCDLPAGHAGWHEADNLAPPLTRAGRALVGSPTRMSWSADALTQKEPSTDG